MARKPNEMPSDNERVSEVTALWLWPVLAHGREVLHGEVLSDLSSPCSADFLARCAEAGRVAMEVARLRHARNRAGFLPVSVHACLEQLARSAGVPLGAVTQTFQLDFAAPHESVFAHGWARLAQQIGLTLREALLHLRLSFLEMVSPHEMPAPVRLRQSIRSRHPQIEYPEELFTAITQRWTDHDRQLLRVAEAEVRAVYEAEQGGM